MPYQVSRRMLQSILVLWAAVAGCKPPKAAPTTTQSATANDALANCAAAPDRAKDVDAAPAYQSLVNNIVAPTAALKQVTADTLKAVPLDIQKIFLALDGKIIVSSKAASVCSVKAPAATAASLPQDVKAIVAAQNRQASSCFIAINSAHVFQAVALETAPSLAFEELAVVIQADDAIVRDGLVRVFGALSAAILANVTESAAKPGTLVWQRDANTAFAKLKTDLATAYFKDVAIYSPNDLFLKTYLAQPDHSSTLPVVAAAIYATVFNSYFCNDWSPSPKQNTLQPLIQNYYNSYSVFRAFQERALAPLSLAEDEEVEPSEPDAPAPSPPAQDEAATDWTQTNPAAAPAAEASAEPASPPSPEASPGDPATDAQTFKIEPIYDADGKLSASAQEVLDQYGADSTVGLLRDQRFKGLTTSSGRPVVIQGAKDAILADGTVIQAPSSIDSYFQASFNRGVDALVEQGRRILVDPNEVTAARLKDGVTDTLKAASYRLSPQYEQDIVAASWARGKPLSLGQVQAESATGLLIGDDNLAKLLNRTPDGTPVVRATDPDYWLNRLGNTVVAAGGFSDRLIIARGGLNALSESSVVGGRGYAPKFALPSEVEGAAAEVAGELPAAASAVEAGGAEIGAAEIGAAEVGAKEISAAESVTDFSKPPAAAYKDFEAERYANEAPGEAANRQFRYEQGSFKHTLSMDELAQKYRVTETADYAVDPQAIKFGQSSVNDSFGSGGGPNTTKMVPDENGVLVKRGRTIAEVADDLRAGRISPDDLPVDVVEINGEVVSVNNRSLTTLTQAGLQPTVINKLTPATLPATGADSLESVLNRLEAMPGFKPSPVSYVRQAGPNWTGAMRNAADWDAPFGYSTTRR